MARRKARIPQGKKIQPAVKTLQFTVPLGNNYVDLSQCASLVNRRFYRQGLNWAVAGFSFFTAADASGSIGISKIPDTWIASNSWMKGFATWQKSVNEALEETESIKAKFTDFKIYMDPGHHAAGKAANLIPVDTAGNPYTKGEWDYSQVHIPTSLNPASGLTDDFDIMWTGASFPGTGGATGNDAVSLIEGYAASRGLPDIRDPNAPADAADAEGATPENWMAAMFNENTDQTHEIIEDMLTENNKAPYPFENDGTATDTQYPGGANQAPGLAAHLVANISPTTVGGRTTIEGGNFQGGLIKLTNNSGDAAMTMFIHLVPGPHRGYMCQAMQDV